MKVKKRDNRLVDFNPSKIKNAITKAFIATEKLSFNVASNYCFDVYQEVLKKIKSLNKEIISVEEIQDIVEETLMKHGQYKTAKAYIVYREKRRQLREAKNFMKHLKKYINQDPDIVKQNANVVYSYPALRGYIAGEVIKKYVLEEMYPEEVRRAHLEGWIHIHDLDFGNAVYCVGHNLRLLIAEGFSGPDSHVASAPAKHLDTIVEQMVNYLGVLQNEAAGAQAFNSVDTLLAPFVREDKLSYKEVKQFMQHLIYGCNITSRWGQSPFINFTFDLVPPEDLKDEYAIIGGRICDYKYGELQKEMDMINEAFWEIMLEGDYKNKIFTFPIPTINVTENFPFNKKPIKKMLEATAKYGIPYFANFVNSWLDPRAVRSMCCRLSLDLEEIKNYTGGLFGAADATGSIGVVTINLPRLAYVAKKTDNSNKISKFFQLLDYYLEVAKISLEIKRKEITRNLEKGLFPYLKKYLGSFKTFFSTIGIVGSHEMCLNLLGIGIETKEGHDFTLRVLEHIRKRTEEFKQQTGNLYNFEATPAESTAYRFARIDKNEFIDIITSGDDIPYYTNSSHLPVGYTSDLIETLKHQEDLQSIYTSGTVLHIFLPDAISSEEAETVIKFVVENSKVPYFSITPTYSICPEHGYLHGEVIKCPKCAKECLVYSRVTGYYRPVQNWNPGKQEEWKDRKDYKLEQILI